MRFFVSMLVMLTVALFGCASVDSPEPQVAPSPAEEAVSSEAPAEEGAVQEVEGAKDEPEAAAADSSGSDG